jgi:hypothetical protein
MADSAPSMRDRRLLFLLVPVLGVAELVAHRFFAERAPETAEWRALAAPLAQLVQPGDLVLVAPEWASPIARHALGERFFPIAAVARADERSFSRAVEISALGERSDATRAWRLVSEHDSGRFTLRVLQNPEPELPTYRFLDHVVPERLAVSVASDGEDTPCSFDARARPLSGGLHGNLAFPSQRFRCGARANEFVGLTIADDQDYRPRRCIWAHTPVSGALRLEFRDVPLGRRIRGYAGSSYFLMRDGGAAVELSVHVEGERLGHHRHDDERGFSPYVFETGKFAGSTRTVRFEVRSAESREFCFTAEST